MILKSELTVDDLAQEIRRVDGSNSLGAGALAEALMPFLTSRLPRQEDETRKAALEEGKAAGVAECLEHIAYIRKNIRFQDGPRKRFDIYDLDRALRNTCTLIKERITGEDAGTWVDMPEEADAQALSQKGDEA